MVAPSGGVLEPYAGRQLDRDFFRPAGLFDTATDPMDVRALDAIVVLKEGARPDIGGQLIFQYADFAALEVLRLFDPVGSHIERRVAKGARDESGHGDIGTVVLRGLDRVARQRQFADIELGGAEGAKEYLLRDERHVDRIDAVDRNAAVDQGTRSIIVAHRDREIELGHFTSSHDLLS